jgi:hydroxypyruvate isomerase
MPRLAANITLMFTERPFLDRIDAAADAGFRGIECVAPYEAPAEVIAERLQRRGLELALFNFAIGDWAGGDRGIAADPLRVEDFYAEVGRARDYARATGCKRLHLMAGKVPRDADLGRWTETLVANVRFAAQAMASDGIEVMLEPINTRIDIPGYFYDTTAAALAVMGAVGRPNVKLQYDIYHMQIMEGDIARTIERLLPRIGHIQIADNPGRGEPGTGEINFPWLLARLDQLGYAGWVGAEYRPVGDTVEGLGWAQPYLAERAG